MDLEIKLRDHTAPKMVLGLLVQKSFNMDAVDLRGSDGIFRHCGWYARQSKTFSGLTGWDNSLNEDMARAIAKLTNSNVSFTDAPRNDEPEPNEEDEEDDEFE